MGAYKFRAGTRVELYNLKTGEKQSFHGVDAKMCLERGGWSLDAPATAPQAVELQEEQRAPVESAEGDEEKASTAIEDDPL